jgi:hypothetical protein
VEAHEQFEPSVPTAMRQCCMAGVKSVYMHANALNADEELVEVKRNFPETHCYSCTPKKINGREEGEFEGIDRMSGM